MPTVPFDCANCYFADSLNKILFLLVIKYQVVGKCFFFYPTVRLIQYIAQDATCKTLLGIFRMCKAFLFENTETV
jgi:hypothetical protein